MPKKKFTKTHNACRVTFELPGEIAANRVMLMGDFNNWDEDANPMKRRKDGRFSTTVTLQPGEYRYRFLLDGERWENDWDAEEYARNTFGTEDSIVRV